MIVSKFSLIDSQLFNPVNHILAEMFLLINIKLYSMNSLCFLKHLTYDIPSNVSVIKFIIGDLVTLSTLLTSFSAYKYFFIKQDSGKKTKTIAKKIPTPTATNT